MNGGVLKGDSTFYVFNILLLIINSYTYLRAINFKISKNIIILL